MLQVPLLEPVVPVVPVVPLVAWREQAVGRGQGGQEAAAVAPDNARDAEDRRAVAVAADPDPFLPPLCAVFVAYNN